MSSKISAAIHLRHAAITISLLVVSFHPLRANAADLFEIEPAAFPLSEIVEKGRFTDVRQKLSDWQVFVSAGAMYAPKFEGSDELKLVPFPMISATFGRFTVDPGGLEISVLDSNGFKLSAKGGFEMSGREEDDSSHLKGLGDIDAGAVLGTKVSYETGPMEFYASVDKTIGGSDGLLGVVGANVSHNYERFIFSAGASTTFADDSYMESYFGVSAAQSLRSGLPEYEASAGLKRYDIEASVTFMATENWPIRGQAGVGFLAGDAKDSPIVQDDMQPSAMLMARYRSPSLQEK